MGVECVVAVAVGGGYDNPSCPRAVDPRPGARSAVPPGDIWGGWRDSFMGERASGRTGQSAESVTAINEKRSNRENPNQRGRDKRGGVDRRSFMAVHSSTYSCLGGIFHGAGLRGEPLFYLIHWKNVACRDTQIHSVQIT